VDAGKTIPDDQRHKPLSVMGLRYIQVSRIAGKLSLMFFCRESCFDKKETLLNRQVRRLDTALNALHLT
jgi:hypothetical protein